MTADGLDNDFYDYNGRIKKVDNIRALIYNRFHDICVDYVATLRSQAGKTERRIEVEFLTDLTNEYFNIKKMKDEL